MNELMPERIEPMKARLADPDGEIDWSFEVKWDGYRAIAFCGETFRLQGRRLNEIGPDFPEIGKLSREKKAARTILDGELVVFDEQGRPDFQLMQSRRELGAPAHFLIFDLLWANGEDLRKLPYLERRDALESLGLAGESWSVPDRIKASLPEAVAATRGLGLEGVLAKNPQSPYVEGKRSHYWLKVKNTRRQEFVIGGWIPGKGHRSSTFGALLVGYREPGVDQLRFAGRVGSGMNDQYLNEIAARLESEQSNSPPFDSRDLDEIPAGAKWCLPRSVIEVRFTEWTREGRLRNPVFFGLRPDRNPVDVVREEPK